MHHLGAEERAEDIADRLRERLPDAAGFGVSAVRATTGQELLDALRAIPRGATLSYGAIGQRLGRPMATRAVGGAVGRNPISVVVPCHRVVGASGALTGYAGGLDRKRALLALESAG